MRAPVTFVLAAWAAQAAASPGASVVGSKHDFSMTGPGPVKAVSETRVCIFCHVSHAAADGGGLSNRPATPSAQPPYESTTMEGRGGAPSGTTRACLSCHDGTIAVGETRRQRIPMRGQGKAGRQAPSARPSLGIDLRTSHPVSFAPGFRGKTRRPSPNDSVKLDRLGQIQCTTCHDPHQEFAEPDGKFLVRTTRASALCLTCHEETAGATHVSSPASLGAALLDGRASSLAEAGCSACHRSHGGETGSRLLARPGLDDDSLCLRCHSGAVTTTTLDVGADMAKPYSHAVGSVGVHDAAESPSGRGGQRLPETSPGARRHAVCADCHDPHESVSRPATAPLASGALLGVWGIDRDGKLVDPVRFEYEVCFKCHADSANKPQAQGRSTAAAPRRSVADANLRRVFGATAASAHPVVEGRKRPALPGLKEPFRSAAYIYCSDCHASESGKGAGGAGPRGPHGSVYPFLLERSYATADGTVESESAYALCYKCHDRDVLLSAQSGFPLHRSHVVDGRTPCATCHSAHGVSAMAGSPSSGAHLVDFDLNVVRPDGSGLLNYTSGGAGGSCTLTCHGHAHASAAY